MPHTKLADRIALELRLNVCLEVLPDVRVGFAGLCLLVLSHLPLSDSATAAPAELVAPLAMGASSIVAAASLSLFSRLETNLVGFCAILWRASWAYVRY